jgi:transposase
MIGSGKTMVREIKEFSRMTDDIEKLGHWLKEQGIKQIAIESTGVYWKPVFNIYSENPSLMSP